MFKEMHFMVPGKWDVTQKATNFTFHDLPPFPGTKEVRATSHAIITENGDIYLGCSVCSEADHFIKKEGRNKAEAEAVFNMTKRRASGHLDLSQGYETKELNKMMYLCCLEYKVEKFRKMLSDRATLIDNLEKLIFDSVTK